MDEITIAVVSESVLNEAWKTSNEKVRIEKFKSTDVSDKEYDNLKEAFDTMTSTEDYTEYKKAFDKVCRYCHIVSRGVVIYSYKLVKNKEDGKKHSLFLSYSYNTKQITIDDDTVLYHISPNAGITELTPNFKGKAAKGYLYDKHRIYFTMRKNLPKVLTDLTGNKETHTYMCTKKINKVFVDPLVRDKNSRAVYVETTSPIPVKEVNNSVLAQLKKKFSKAEVTSNQKSLFDKRFL